MSVQGVQAFCTDCLLVSIAKGSDSSWSPVCSPQLDRVNRTDSNRNSPRLDRNMTEERAKQSGVRCMTIRLHHHSSVRACDIKIF